MDEEKALLLNAITRRKSEIGKALNIVVNPKCAKASVDVRKKGNNLFLQSKKHDAVTHEKIFNCYCESIALAPNESQELALAYGNRSYFLLHICKYEDCIKDIDRALKITTLDFIKAKLLCRKAECLKKLGYSNFLNVLKMSEKLIDKIDGQDKVKLLQINEATKSLIININIKVEASNNKKDLLPITEDYFSNVSIQYNEKYGRHLVAAKDYKPGDIIINEKIYASFISDRLYTSCHYCSKESWSCIPCQYCNWTMFCSEGCREKAWNDFHDIECSLVSHLKMVETEYWKYFMLSIRVLIIGIKETGSIINLREKLESVDKCKDVTSKGFFINGKFVMNSIQNIYSLSTNGCKESVETVSILIPSILICLTKYSKLQDNFNVKQVEDLMANEDIIFLGSFLIRLIAVKSSNGFGYFDPGDNSLGICFMTTFCSLFNHSCFPTANWRYTEQNTLVINALQPIKTSSQIFIGYAKPFFIEEKSARHGFLLMKYNFVCDCQPCKEAWLPIISLMVQNQLTDPLDFTAKNNRIVMELYEQFMEQSKEGKIKAKFIKKLSKIITHASNFKQPSLTYCLLIDLLHKVLNPMYSLKSLSFDQCDEFRF